MQNTSATTPAPHSIRRAYIVAACFAAVLAACNNSGDPVSPPAITELTGPTATVSVAQGFFATSLIVIKRSSTFDGVVQLTVEGQPQGMLVSIAPSSLSSVATVAEMTITALTTVSPGANSFTVRASGQGVASRTLTVSVMVTVPSFTVAAQITSANVPQGSTQVIPITITREGGFTGIIGLAVIGLPAGVTATFSPPAIESGATTSTLTLSAPLTAQTGVTPATLRASAQGLEDKTVPMQVTVAPATTPAILLSASPVFLQAEGGGFIETALTLQRFAGFGDAVNVSLDDPPTNLTATVPPFAAGSNTTTLRIDVSEMELGLRYDVTVRASGAGVQPASTRLAVQTTATPKYILYFSVSGLFPVSTQPVTINRGSNATVRLQIARNSGYNLPISLTVTGTPAGVSTNLPTTIPSSTNSQAYDIAISVSADAVPGVYSLPIRGQASTTTRNATIELTVK